LRKEEDKFLEHDYEITGEEFEERWDLEPLTCNGSACGHYDSLNEFCWDCWRPRGLGQLCFYSLYVDHEGNVVQVNWKEKETREAER
jgi:hypothetical protein